MDDDAIRRKRVLYRAQHRGFKEADLLIGGFASVNLARMSGAELDFFEKLIELPDHDLYGIASGDLSAPAGFEGPVLDSLRAYHAAKGR